MPTPHHAMATSKIVIPEVLLTAVEGYVRRHPRRDYNQVASAALALFLMQEGSCDRVIHEIYLDSIFGHPDTVISSPDSL
ncbi:MAG: DUF2811 domain-containing protein [Spirulina sp.]